MDFKGWFRLKNGVQCHPLTVMDLYSRYLLCLKGQESERMDLTKQSFDRLFSSNNIPEIIRVDNGRPFGGRNAYGLTSLSLDWIKKGIRVEFIEPGRPDQNGSHERMHRTLKEEVTLPSSKTMRAQQRRFDKWRNEYNELRPHEYLEQRRPADVYEPSTRKSRRLLKHTYPAHYETRKVNNKGEICIDGERYFLSEIFNRELLGLRRVKAGAIEIYLGELCLGSMCPGRHDGLDTSRDWLKV